MKAKNKSIRISTEYHLHTDLSEIVEKKHQDLLRVTNSGLVTLFWEIGKELNHYFGKNRIDEYDKSVIRVISTQLVANYGPYFAEKNLKKMGQFADQFPDLSNVVQFAPFISWEHILLLLQIKDLEAKLFYIRLTVEQELSVNGLRKKISENLFASKAINGRKDRGSVLTQSLNARKFLQLLQPSLKQATRNKLVIKNIFKEPLFSSSRLLIEPSKQTTTLTRKTKKELGNDEELYGILSSHIEKYRYYQNRWLNANLNLFFWEIGKRINQEILMTIDDVYRQSIIHNASVQLKEKYGKNFSEKQLYEMAKFAEQFANSSIATRIAFLVNWEHILVLLSLQELEAKFFYARLTATQGLSVADLRKQIVKNIYAQTRGAKELEHSTIAVLQNPRIKTNVEKKGRATIIETTKFIDLGDNANSSLAVTNIFKNSYFLNFITAF